LELPQSVTVVVVPRLLWYRGSIMYDGGLGFGFGIMGLILFYKR
jgi:hypothetical protein